MDATSSSTPSQPSPRYPVSILKRFEKQKSTFTTGESRPSLKQRSTSGRPRAVLMGPTLETTALPPGLSPVHSPFERPSTPQEKQVTISLDQNAIDEEERFRYRAWREGKASVGGKLLSGKSQRNSGDHSHVGKKIEAKLPRIECSTTVARSRKASQYLGLFKEKDAAEELRRRQHLMGDITVKHRETDKLVEPSVLSTTKKPDIVSDTASVAVGEYRLSKDRASFISSKGQSDLHRQTKAEELQTITPSTEEPPKKLSQSNHASTEADLAEGNHLSHSFPAGDLQQAEAEISRWREQNLGNYKIQAHPHAVEEEDESEHEQISSALYFPHRQLVRQAVSQPVEVEDDDDEEEEEIAPDDQRFAEASRRVKESVSQSPQDVEISLQSQDESQCWHGDLPKSSSSTEEAEAYSSPNEAAVASSESEYDSAEESQSECGYESSTNEAGVTGSVTTPRRATQVMRKHRHEYTGQNPVGAVQLKPYNHQVGGHSTVYRFSRRAVCKQLNNRENEFYETVERLHPELLEFLPRYEFPISFKGPRAESSRLPRATNLSYGLHKYMLTFCSVTIGTSAFST